MLIKVMYVTTFTRFAQNSPIIIMEYACIVWLYHACSNTAGPTKAMNLAPPIEGIRTVFFFLLSVLACLIVKRGKKTLINVVIIIDLIRRKESPQI